MSKAVISTLKEHEYVVVSHHPRDHIISPCTSVHNIFLAEDAPLKTPHHIYLPKTSETSIDNDIENIPSPCFVFNSFASLTRPGSFDILNNAIQILSPVIIYWHETAWNLRDFIKRDNTLFSLIRPLISNPLIKHWVPTYQSAQFLMFLFGIPVERINVVFETIDVAAVRSSAKVIAHQDGFHSRFVGAGLPDLRKGIDLYNQIAGAIAGQFDWYAPRATSQVPNTLKNPINFTWKGNVKNFPNALKNYDVFLMTSRDDPSPIVCLEALALGIPVFAFGTTGYSEVLPNEFLCHDLDDMVDKIRIYQKNHSNYTREFFQSIADRHDVRAFPNKLRLHAETQISAPMPECDEAYIHGDPIALSAKLAKSILDFNKAAASHISWKENYRTALRDLNTQRAEFEEKTKNSEKSNENHFNQIIEDKKKSLSFLKEAHRSARIDIRRSFRNKILEQLDRTPKTVVIVGNSPSILERRDGQFIDSCDLVFRINNFEIHDYEQHTGSKTDFALFTPACKFNQKILELEPSRRLLHAANFHNDREKLKERLTRDGAVGLTPRDLVEIPPTLYYYGLAILMNLPPLSWASTGSVGLQLLIDVFPESTKIYFTGIDFFKDTNRVIRHYFDHETLSDGKHFWHLERTYFESRLHSGRIQEVALA